jgi:hypothetical protein
MARTIVRLRAVVSSDISLWLCCSLVPGDCPGAWLASIHTGSLAVSAAIDILGIWPGNPPDELSLYLKDLAYVVVQENPCKRSFAEMSPWLTTRDNGKITTNASKLVTIF